MAVKKDVFYIVKCKYLQMQKKIRFSYVYAFIYIYILKRHVFMLNKVAKFLKNKLIKNN